MDLATCGFYVRTLTSLLLRAAGEMLLSDSWAEGCQPDDKGGEVFKKVLGLTGSRVVRDNQHSACIWDCDLGCVSMLVHTVGVPGGSWQFTSGFTPSYPFP